MQTLSYDDNETGFFNGGAFSQMHNKSSKKKGLDKNERKASKEYRNARKNKRDF